MSEEQAKYVPTNVLEPQTRQYIDDRLLSGKAGRSIAETRDLLTQGLQQKATTWLDDFNERVAIAVKEMVLSHGYSVEQVEAEYDRAYGQAIEHTARAQVRLAAGWWVRVRDKETR